MSQLTHHFVRIGLLGRVGKFASPEAVVYPRGAEVVCRTDRGLEVGDVLAHAKPTASSAVDGTLIRQLSVEDRLLLSRLEKNRDQAFTACEQLLTRHAVEATLVDVEQLFDGQTIYFYFLGDAPAEAELLMKDLTATYEAQARIQDFATAVEQGCGPDCGTDAASGCGSGDCASCAVAAACKA